ncbi:MAG: hypothetical protein KKD39_00385, partial [Candidatus Altiarchaeota archaeon]|nr:hypothetical protein [Candidatus Altiarchaeota archaeon]
MKKKCLDEIGFLDVIAIVKENIATIIFLTIVASFVSLIYFSTTEKTYESSAVIKLAKIDGELVMSPYEALEIMKSDAVIKSVIKRYFPGKNNAKFLEDNFHQSIANVEGIQKNQI